MPVPSSLSPKGIRFLRRHEGIVLHAYKDPVGVITIGCGFTMRSTTFAAYWIAKRGHRLRMGDTITASEVDEVLELLVQEEYGKAVAENIRPKQQHQFDGAVSPVFNLGTGAAKWKWAKALASGDIARAAALLRTTGTTAGGRELAGLVRRRHEEARLIELGDYGDDFEDAARPSTREAIREYQGWLRELGYYTGDVDGIRGELTDGAVLNFQRNNGLLVDGIVGPATRAMILRRLEEKTANEVSAAGGGIITILAPFLQGMTVPVLIGLVVAGVVVVYGAFWLWRNRGIFTGQRQPT
jgi:lysozyme